MPTAAGSTRKLTFAVWACVALICLSAAGYWGWNRLQERQFRQRCEEARRNEDWRSEREIAKSWAAWDPAANDPWWRAAEAAQELEDPEDVAFCLGHVQENDPKFLFAFVEKANLEWTVLNRPLEALETSQLIISKDPKVAEIQSRLISFYAMTLQRVELIKSIRAAIAVRAEPREAYTYLILADSLSFANGADLNGRWLAACPDDLRFKIGLAVSTSESIFRNADVAASANAAELEQEADRQLKWFLESASHNPALLTYLMNRAYEGGNVGRIGELLQKVDDSGVNDHMVWVYRGWYHMEMKELADAELALQEALRLHSLSGLAHHEYARLLRLMQRPEAEVEQQQRIARSGKQLRGKLILQQNARDVPLEVFDEIISYAQECGDNLVAEGLSRRLNRPLGKSAETVSTDGSSAPNTR